VRSSALDSDRNVDQNPTTGTTAIAGAGAIDGAEVGAVPGATTLTAGSEEATSAPGPLRSGVGRLVADAAATAGAAGTGSSPGRVASETAATSSATVATVTADHRVRSLIERVTGVTTLL
jgi:hypothetical protein